MRSCGGFAFNIAAEFEEEALPGAASSGKTECSTGRAGASSRGAPRGRVKWRGSERTRRIGVVGKKARY